jgi:hypothetical protein
MAAQPVLEKLGVFYGVSSDGRVESIWAERQGDKVYLWGFTRSGVSRHIVPTSNRISLDSLCAEVHFAFALEEVEAVAADALGTPVHDEIRERIWRAAAARQDRLLSAAYAAGHAA